MNDHDANETERLLEEAAKRIDHYPTNRAMIDRLCAKVRELQHWETHAMTAMRRARLAEDARDAATAALDLYRSVAEDAKGQWSDDYLWEKWELSQRMEKAERLTAHQPAKGQ